ncbi:ABC transporter permease [Pseudooceanicola sp. HF7]|uniref:ABC transporter permease n=1 Tax=Pseudooceanicola sp. HF7 TaxID=2721560 RepID=UPI001431D661|nr:ABC transporter permease [Pseudooceanicola sp. HF7]NIZ09547.1 ABC transporter permease [Pseudooceanicola sp. HF7]
MSVFSRSASARVGGLLLGAVLGLTLLGPLAYPVDPLAMVDMPLLPPLSPHAPLGTDVLGRDLLARMIEGSRTTLLTGAGAGLLAVLTGLMVGLGATSLGGPAERALQRLTEFFQLLPALLLTMVLIAFLGTGLWVQILTIAALTWPPVARVARTEALRLRHMDFVTAARASGTRPLRILTHTILPNALPPLAAVSGLTIGTALLYEAGLGFLGLSDPNRLSLGLILGQNRNDLLAAWWTVTLPGLAIFFTVLGTALLADGLAQALSPHARNRR